MLLTSGVDGELEDGASGWSLLPPGVQDIFLSLGIKYFEEWLGM